MKHITTALSAIAGAAVMSLCSCSSRTDSNVTVLTDEVKTEAVSVSGETVPYS